MSMHGLLVPAIHLEMSVWRPDMGSCENRTRRCVHRLACQSEEKPQYLCSVILELFARAHRILAANTALPYCHMNLI